MLRWKLEGGKSILHMISRLFWGKGSNPSTPSIHCKTINEMRWYKATGLNYHNQSVTHYANVPKAHPSYTQAVLEAHPLYVPSFMSFFLQSREHVCNLHICRVWLLAQTRWSIVQSRFGTDRLIVYAWNSLKYAKLSENCTESSTDSTYTDRCTSYNQSNKMLLHRAGTYLVSQGQRIPIGNSFWNPPRINSALLV